MIANDDLRGKITAYGNFVTKTLQPQLQAAVDARDEVEAEISEYAALQKKLRDIEKIVGGDMPRKQSTAMDTLVDISHGTIFCNATIPNPRTVYVNVGFGFHVEMTLSEAIAFIDKRVEYLNTNVLKHRMEVARTVAKDVEDALELLEGLGGELVVPEGEVKHNL